MTRWVQRIEYAVGSAALFAHPLDLDLGSFLEQYEEEWLVFRINPDSDESMWVRSGSVVSVRVGSEKPEADPQFQTVQGFTVVDDQDPATWRRG